MPQEMRLIGFTDDEILDALTVLLKQREEGLPENTTNTVVHSRDADGHVVTMLVAQSADTTTEILFAHQETLAAMLHKCMELKIPMPRHAEKKLDIMDDMLVLRMRTAEESQAGDEADAA